MRRGSMLRCCRRVRRNRRKMARLSRSAQAGHVAQNARHVPTGGGDEDGLGVLHVGTSRHGGVSRALSLADEGPEAMSRTR